MKLALWAPPRRLPLLGLLGLALAEAGALAGGALSLKAAIDAGADPAPSLHRLGAIGAWALAAAALGWARLTAAEDFGMRYANDLRLGLSEHAVAMAAGGRRRRLGALAVRLTGDLNALRDWAALGVADLTAAAAALLAGAGILALGLGAGGLVIAGAGLAPPLVACLLLWWPLRGAHQGLRQARGRVAALAGDIVLSAPTVARFDALERENRRLAKRNEGLRAAAVRRRSRAALMRAPAAATLACGVAVGLSMGAWGLPGPSTAADWAAAAFGLGFIASGAVGLTLAADAFLGFSVARARMTRLAADIAAAAATGPDSAPTLAVSARRAPVSLPWDGARRTLAAGEIMLLDGGPAAACAAVERFAGPGGGVWLGERPVSALRRRDAARLFPLAAPAAPLLRASLRRNLSLRRQDASDADLAAALAAAGLDPADWPPGRLLDPALADPDEWTQARLRLARAIAHRPRVIFLAEPTLLAEPGYRALLDRTAATSGAALVAPAPAPP